MKLKKIVKEFLFRASLMIVTVGGSFAVLNYLKWKLLLFFFLLYQLLPPIN